MAATMPQNERQDPVDDEYLLPSEVSDLLHVDVQRLAREGGGPPFVQLSRKVRRYRRSDVNAWIESKTREAQAS